MKPFKSEGSGHIFSMFSTLQFIKTMKHRKSEIRSRSLFEGFVRLTMKNDTNLKSERPDHVISF